MSTSWELRRVAGADDPDLPAAAALLHAVFADPNTVLGLDRLQEFLAAPADERVFTVLVAKAPAGAVVGCTVFSYVPASNCGFSEYIAAAGDHRRAGLGRALFDARHQLLDQHARAAGQAACRGLFIEADNPLRVPPDLLDRERQTALDPRERLRLFAHFGFKRVDVAYVQPPLGPGKQPVSYLDLLFVPWLGPPETIESSRVIDTLTPIWRSWSPQTYQRELRALRARLPRSLVPLQPLGDALQDLPDPRARGR